MSNLFVVESSAARNTAQRLRTAYVIVLLILAVAFWLRDAKLIRHIEIGAQGSQDISIACEQRTLAYRIANLLMSMRDGVPSNEQKTLLDQLERDLNEWKSSSTYVLSAAMEHSNDDTPMYSPLIHFQKAEEQRRSLEALARQALTLYRGDGSADAAVTEALTQSANSSIESFLENLPEYSRCMSQGIGELSLDFFADTNIKQEWAHKWTWILLCIVVCMILFILEPSIRSITRQQQEELNMRAELNRLALVARKTNNAVIITDEKQEIRWVNAGFTRLTGYELDEVINKVPGHVLQCENTDPNTVQRLRDHLREGRECRVEILNRSKNGNEYWLDIEVQPLRDKSESVIGFIAVETDITASVLQREELAEKEQIARRALKSHEDLLAAAVQTSVIATDPTGRITLFSRGAENMLGYRAEEVLNGSPAIFHDRHEMELRAVELSKELNRPIEGFEIFVAKTRDGGHDTHKWIYRRKDGGELQVSLIVSAIRDENGEISGFLGIATDITRIIEAENRLQRVNEELERSFAHANLMAEQANAANVAKSEFLANMSHEIRTPMNGVIGMTLMLLDTPLNAEQRHFAEVVRESAESLLALINDILDFSKIEAGKLSIECIALDIRHIMSGVNKVMRLRAEQKGLHLSIEIDDAVPQWLMGDPSRLRQVLFNLLGNAIKFTLVGHVRAVIEMEKTDHEAIWLRFRVMDTGIGIDEQKMKLLFNKFSQVDASTTREFGGTGLGLAICKQLVELMGGAIGVTSELHRGSEFWFVLPLKLQTTDVSTQHPEPPKLMASLHQVASMRDCFKGYRFLLAEDNLVNQEVARGMLLKLGCFVEVVNHGKEALEALTKQDYDLILMDVQMPEMDGFEATRRIRDSDLIPVERRKIPIIAMTAHAMEGDRERCVAAGMNDYICKPIALEPMINTLARCLSVEVIGSSADLENLNQLDTSATARLCDATFDANELLDRFMGDVVLVSEIIDDFLIELPQDIAVMRESIERGEVAQMIQRSHALRGAAANMAADRLAAIAAKIENGAVDQDLEFIKQYFDEMESEVSALVKELQTWLAAHEFGKID